MRLFRLIKAHPYDTLCIVIVILSVCPLIATAFYSHPSSDDFRAGFFSHEGLVSNGFIGVIQAAVDFAVDKWITAQGTYSSCFLFAFEPGIWGEGFYALTFMLMAAISLVGMVVLMRSLAKCFIGLASYHEATMIAVMLWFFWIMTLPDPEQGLYWYVGACHYTVFWSCAFIVVGIALRVLGGLSYKWWAVTGASLMSLFVGGGNYVSSFGLVLMMGFLCIVSLYKRRGHLVFAIFAFAVIGFAVSALAPGNLNRAANLDGLPPLEAMLGAAKATLAYSEQWISFNFICLQIIILPFVLKLALIDESKCEVLAAINGRNIAVFAMLAIAFIFALFCVPYYSIGDQGAGRIQNAIYVAFIVLASLFVLMIEVFLFRVIKLHWDEEFSEKSLVSGHYLIIATICYLLVLMPSSTCLIAVKGLANGSFAEFDAVMDKREMILNDPSIENATLPALKTTPPLIGGDTQPTEDPADTTNYKLTRYYHKNSVVVEDVDFSES